MKKITRFFMCMLLLGLLIPKAGNAQAPDWTRLLQMNTYGSSSLNVVTSDASNAFVAGKISGPLTLDGINYTNVGLGDLFISKVSQAGVTAWVKQINAQAGGTITPDAIKVDAGGNVYVSASFSGTVTIGNTITSGALYNAFYAKFDNAGNGVWVTPYLSTGSGISKIALDGSGNSYLLSKTTKIIKFESTGALLWEQAYMDRTLQAVAVYGTNLYLGGTLQTTTTFGTITLNTLGGYNTGYMVKAGLDGVYTNSMVVGGSILNDGSSVSEIVPDNSGNLVITGSYTQNLVLGGITITHPVANSKYYTYIAKCNTDFVFAWAQSSTVFTAGSSYNARKMWAYRLFLDNSNNIYEYGIIDNSFSFGTVALTLATGNQFLIKFDADGNALSGFALSNTSYLTVFASPAGKIITGGPADNLVSGSIGNFYFAQAGSNMLQDWQKVTSDSQTGIVAINCIKHDADGNTYIQARLTGYCNYFGTIINSGSYLTIISKHDISGTPLWIKQIADISPFLFGPQFTLDKDNNVLMVGLFQTSLDIGNITLTSANAGYEGYVAKYNPAGEFQWASKMDLNSDVSNNISLATDNAGNVVVTGIISPANYLVKFNSSGSRLWAKIFPMESYYISLVSTDDNNNIFITSEIHLSDATGSTTIGNITLTQTHDDGATALIKFDPDGNALWAKTYGGLSGANYSDGWPSDIKTDAAGNAYIWGWCVNNGVYGSFTLTNPYTPNQNYSYVLVKINSSGDVAWAKGLYEAKFATNYGDLLDLDKNGNVYIGGHFKDKISIDGSEYLPEATYDFFTAKIAGNGVFQWIKTIPSDYSIIKAISVYDDNILSVAGASGKNSTLGSFDIIRNSGSNCMVATLASTNPEPASLLIGSPDGSMITYSIFSTFAWTATSDQEWLTVSSASGTGCATLTFTAGANPTTSPRTAIVTITFSGSRNAVQTITIVQDAGTVGIIALQGEESLIYPNPANDMLFFNSALKNAEVFIYDLNGILLLKEQMVGSKMNISSLRNGVYTLKVVGNSGVINKKFVKQ